MVFKDHRLFSEPIKVRGGEFGSSIGPQKVAIEAVEQDHDYVLGVDSRVVGPRKFLVIHAPTLRTPSCGIVRCSYER